MTPQCKVTVDDLAKSNQVFAELTVEQLLFAAIAGTDFETVLEVLLTTDWASHGAGSKQMTSKEAFEKWEELPEFCVFNERINAYIWKPYDDSTVKAHPHNALWLAWQNGARWQADEDSYIYSQDGKMRINKNGNFGF